MFLGVKAIEYSHKWDTGILWSKYFSPREHAEHSNALLVMSIPAAVAVVITVVGWIIATKRNAAVTASLCKCLLITSVAFFAGVGLGKGIPQLMDAMVGSSHHGTEHPTTTPSENGGRAHIADGTDHEAVSGLHAVAGQEDKTAMGGDHPAESKTQRAGVDPVYTGIFFSIYFVMTGLHAIHIIAGMGVIAWLVRRSLLGHFGPSYFGPVDFVGLYWHLVDLIWIYLFPLLYLIG
jgi:cytochrome c oxidase subunit 3